MIRLRAIAHEMRTRLEEIPELQGKVVVFFRASINTEFEKRMKKPAPGKYEDSESIVVSSSVEHAFSLQQFTEMTLAELVLGGAEPVDGVFVPGGATELLTGWWIVQAYNQANLKTVALNIWGEARCDGYTFKEGLDPYAIVITQLSSTLNTGEITNLTLFRQVIESWETNQRTYNEIVRNMQRRQEQMETELRELREQSYNPTQPR